MRLQFIPRDLEALIDEAVTVFPDGPLERLAHDSLDEAGQTPLAIKYIPARYARTAGAGLRISGTAGFTWGDATYVAPLVFPVSTAIYGRVGVVAGFRPAGWRVFDATVPANQALYMAWAQAQPRSRQLLLTMHAQLANQFLRNQFRTAFAIDCVLFHPDQRNRWYTDPTDVWMAVSDWAAGALVRTGASAQFVNAQMTVLVEEEFEPIGHDLRRRTLIGPRSPRAPNATATAAIRRAYAAGDVVHLHA
jgi:hypothetical protein